MKTTILGAEKSCAPFLKVLGDGSLRAHATWPASCAAAALLCCLFGGSAHGQSIAPAATPPANEQQPPQAITSPHPKDALSSTPLSPSTEPSGNGSAAITAPHPEVGDTRTLDEALGGIVSNEVVTMIGQNFYNYFASLWRDYPLAERYNISIHERPDARWGSLVWVEYEHRRLFEAFLSPARSDIKQAAGRAAAEAYQSVVRVDIDRLLFRDQDLGPDEM
ncbi:CsgE family curli-type amyloid fiber assembly protein [Paraburkholderia sp. J12]|uniref:CsgE family curli-type amyloid fiber assembly protein n=1 Tax=Paraburkholderia sp. J12 TaxID=2805432 RepID=UPI002ABDE634|nr:CsgE family curli-type amyloid fiber assembly protein [Paraburkholderia sp. J12]